MLSPPTIGAGYSGTPLLQKLGIRANSRIFLYHAPDNFMALLGPMPEKVRQLSRPGKNLDYIHLFSRERDELRQRLPAFKAALAKDGTLWISWPKKASGVPTDLSGNIVRELGLSVGLVDTKVCAIDATWSGLKFVYRRSDRS